MERWYTRDELLAAKSAMIASMPGWRMPVAYGLGVADGEGGEVDWRVTNLRNEHELPAVVLAEVTGYRTGTVGLRLDLATFDAAIALLTPAATCDAWEHPNLWAWEAVRSEISAGTLASGARVVVAFVGIEDDDSPDSLDDAVDDPIVGSFRRAVGLG
jgi:hypothetical protein